MECAVRDSALLAMGCAEVPKAGVSLSSATQGGFELRQAAAGSLLHLDRVYVSVDTGDFEWSSLLPGELGTLLLGKVPTDSLGFHHRTSSSWKMPTGMLSAWFIGCLQPGMTLRQLAQV